MTQHMAAVHVAKLGFSMDLILSEKKLYLLDSCELGKKSFEGKSQVLVFQIMRSPSCQ